MSVGAPAKQNRFLLKGNARTFILGNDYKQMLERNQHLHEHFLFSQHCVVASAAARKLNSLAHLMDYQRRWDIYWAIFIFPEKY